MGLITQTILAVAVEVQVRLVEMPLLLRLAMVAMELLHQLVALRPLTLVGVVVELEVVALLALVEQEAVQMELPHSPLLQRLLELLILVVEVVGKETQLLVRVEEQAVQA